MGGTDDASNLVELTVEEHAEAHRVLFELYGRWQDNVAWKALSGHIGKEEIIHEIHKNMNKGRIPTVEAREKMAAAKRGKKISEEHKKALNEGRKNSKNSKEHNLILSNIWQGKKLSEEHRDNISKSKLKNPNNKEIASKAGKASAEKYKKDPLRQQAHSERMKKWWDEKRKVGT